MTKQVGVKTSEARRAVKRLSRYDFEPANTLHVRLAAAYGRYAGDQRVPVGITDSEEFRLLRKVATPTVLRCRYVARYRCLIRSSIDDTVLLKKEVIVKSNERPALARKFRISGVGARRFRLVGYYDNHTKESHLMAKKKSAATVDPNEVEGIENLEDVEDLEDLEDTDFEEPETEDEEDDTNELSGMTLKELRAKAKAASITGASKKSKEELVALLSAADDEEDDEEEDGDDLDGLDRAELKKRLAAASLPKAKKSETDDDLRARLRAVEADEEEDEDDGLDAMDRKQLKAVMAERGLGKAKKSQSEDDLRAVIRAGAPAEEPAPPKKKSGSGGNNLPNRELPAGKHGADAIATAAGVSARDVRVFLRNNKEKFPKDEALGRYAFTKKQVEQVAKAMKAAKK